MRVEIVGKESDLARRNLKRRNRAEQGLSFFIPKILVCTGFDYALEHALGQGPRAETRRKRNGE